MSQKPKDGQFCFSLHEEGNYHGFYDSKEEAIKDGNFEAKECSKDKFYIGKVNTVGLPSIDVDAVLDNIGESMMDEYGEAAEDYLCCLPQEDRDDLSERLDEVFHKWLIDNDQVPTFFVVEDVEEVKVQEVAESEDEDENIRTADREFQETKTS